MADIQIPVRELNSFDLPSVCLVTGATTGVEFKPVKFWWYPRWVPFLIFFPWGGLLLAAIVGLAVRKKAQGELPFTSDGWGLWKRAQWIWGLSIAWFLIAFVATLGLLAAQADGTMIGLVALTALALPIAGWVFSHKHLLQVRRIKDEVLTLQIPSADAALRIREHLFPVQAQPVMAQPVVTR